MKYNKFFFAALVIAFAASSESYAADNYRIDTSSDSSAVSVADTLTNVLGKPTDLKEATVTSFMTSRRVIEMPASLNVTGAYEIRKRSSVTVADAISTEPGVSMGGDGVWAKNVNIRGLGEGRLVTLIDGNRVETATDLTASLSMIDVNDIERVEVIKGAQSSLYGSGAMGGIVNVITRGGYFADKNYFEGNLTSSFASANTNYSEYLSLNAGGKKWYLKVSGTYGAAKNMRTPLGMLENSQFNTYNVSAKVGFKPFKNHILKLQYQRNYSYDVGIPGGSTFPQTATARYTNIGRDLIDASYEINKLTDIFSSLKVSYFHQAIGRDVLMNPNTVTETKLPNGNIQRQTPTSITPLATHVTNGGKIQGTMDFGDINTMIFGVDAWRRDITADRTKNVTMEIINPQSVIAKTNYIVRNETPLPDASSTNAGLFIQDEAHFFNKRLTLMAGARFDMNWTKNDTVYNVNYTIVNDVRNDNPAGKQVTFDAGKSFNVSWSANAGLLFKAAKDIDLTLNLARSYRAPSLEERFKYIDLGNVVRLGNPNLKPEDGYSAELGFRIWKSKINLEASAYVNRLRNMIVEAPGEPLEGGAATLVNKNVGKAFLYGFELKVDYDIYRGLGVFFSGSYVCGRDTENNLWLPGIPPLNGRLGFRYTYDEVGTISFTAVAAAAQNKIATGEVATKGYCRMDLTLSTRRFELGRYCSLQGFAGIENIADVAYTNHLSTNRGDVSVEPGRNFYVRLNFTF